MKSIREVLKEKRTGLYYGNRVLLPFSCHILKLNIENDLITDFSPSHTRVFRFLKIQTLWKFTFMITKILVK